MIATVSFLAEHSQWLPLVVFCARVVDVSIGTFRVISVTRGHRFLATFLGFFEVTIWILAASQVFVHLDQWVNVLAWAGGFAMGNMIGMWIEQRVALGTQTVMFISRGQAHAVAERLRYAGLLVTTLSGSGRDGPVAMGIAVVPRKLTQVTMSMAKEIDPDVVITVQDVRSSTVKAVPQGLLPQMRARPSVVDSEGHATAGV